VRAILKLCEKIDSAPKNPWRAGTRSRTRKFGNTTEMEDTIGENCARKRTEPKRKGC